MQKLAVNAQLAGLPKAEPCRPVTFRGGRSQSPASIGTREAIKSHRLLRGDPELQIGSAEMAPCTRSFVLPHLSRSARLRPRRRCLLRLLYCTVCPSPMPLSAYHSRGYFCLGETFSGAKQTNPQPARKELHIIRQGHTVFINYSQHACSFNLV